MATTPSPKKLTPFHVRNKDLKKDTATLFIRIHTRKVDFFNRYMIFMEHPYHSMKSPQTYIPGTKCIYRGTKCSLLWQQDLCREGAILTVPADITLIALDDRIDPHQPITMPFPF